MQRQLEHKEDLASNYTVQYPTVLFLLFNRLNTTRKVFDAIRTAKLAKLYIASDGTRLKNDNDISEVKVVRDYLLAKIDWVCEVKTLFREGNLECKNEVSASSKRFFENLIQNALPVIQLESLVENIGFSTEAPMAIPVEEITTLFARHANKW